MTTAERTKVEMTAKTIDTILSINRPFFAGLDQLYALFNASAREVVT